LRVLGSGSAGATELDDRALCDRSLRAEVNAEAESHLDVTPIHEAVTMTRLHEAGRRYAFYTGYEIPVPKILVASKLCPTARRRCAGKAWHHDHLVAIAFSASCRASKISRRRYSARPTGWDGLVGTTAATLPTHSSTARSRSRC
jgi:hypothetical protein